MFTATDIGNFLACRHLATLERAAAAGTLTRPFSPDPSLELLLKLGIQHELRFLQHLREEPGADIAEIPGGTPWPRAVAKTTDAMYKGAAVVYQAALQFGEWGGRADFLIRVDRPSALGFWSYEAIEAKLARSTKGPALIQLCLYSELLTRIQGIEPESMHLVLGGTISSTPGISTVPDQSFAPVPYDGSGMGDGPKDIGGPRRESYQARRFGAYFRRVKREFEEAFQYSPATYPEPNEHCRVCSWFRQCDARWRSDDYLSLVAGITKNQRRSLVERSVRTVAGLAALALPVEPRIERIGESALKTIHEQARLQVEGREQGRPIYELLRPAGDKLGLAALPTPSPGDMFFDFEGAPYAFDEGLEYLFGVVTLSEETGADPVYQALWALDRAAEKLIFEQFIAWVIERLARHPGMHIYHFAPYEPTAIKRLAGRHATCVDEVDRLLRAGIFVDLYHVVRQSLQASVESYSIKKLEPLYGFDRSTSLEDADRALMAFEALLAFGPGPDTEAAAGLRNSIEGYNCDDCISTLRLRNWLEHLRRELELKTGQTIARPQSGSGDPSEEVAAQVERAARMVGRLAAELPADETEWTEAQSARCLLAQILEWHRREAKSTWWEYFRLCGLSDQELQEDKNALGGLVYAGDIGREKRSIIHRYRFTPQDHAIDRANQVHDPRTRSGAGSVVAIDDLNGTIDMRRASSSEVPHPTALIPYDIVSTQVLSDSLMRLATYVADHGIEGPGEFRAARDLLLRRPPRIHTGLLQAVVGDNRNSVQSAQHAVLDLEDSVLAIQGPPGSGKTYLGARMVLELVKNGRRVGITAGSHKVISNILDELCKAADEAAVPLRTAQRVDGEEDCCSHARVTQIKSNAGVLDAIADGMEVVAGTAWLWSRGEMAGSVDVLFVDEAGQMSLANVLAVSQAANSLVLLGDPQQLDQPQKGIHPPGADVSAMAHVLNGQATIAPTQGIFLDETWRLPPRVCEFTSEVFYEGRLRSRPENGNQRLNAPGPLDGTGLRFVPVDHIGNRNESPEEAERVAEIVNTLMVNGSSWTDKRGATMPLGLENILVVSPYNVQVSALANRMPGARVGTVDRFQGQQAPVVIYSMATSTPEDAPRGMEFLYSLNRLNVAVSRAQCVAVIVACPALFQVQCKTPRQMELANAFCRYLELAGLVAG